MNGSTVLRRPNTSTETQRREFARLVRRGFETAGAGLDDRICTAKCLAFHYPTRDKLGAIAALKSPNDQYRHDIFGKAGAPEICADYKVELGWVYVDPAYRGNRIATKLCELLLSCATTDCVFATTRTNNALMSRVLLTFGFANVGTPYMRRGEQLGLYLRPC